MANINELKNWIEEEREVTCKYINDDGIETTVTGLPTYISENERELFINGSDGLEHGMEVNKIKYIEA